MTSAGPIGGAPSGHPTGHVATDRVPRGEWFWAVIGAAVGLAWIVLGAGHGLLGPAAAGTAFVITATWAGSARWPASAVLAAGPTLVALESRWRISPTSRVIGTVVVIAGLALVGAAVAGPARAKALGVAGLVAIVAAAPPARSAVFAVVLSASAVAVAWKWPRPAAVLALLAAAAAVSPLGSAPMTLLAAAAALSLPWWEPVAAVAGLPGAIAVLAAAAPRSGSVAVVAVCAASVGGALLLVRPPQPRPRVAVELLPATAAAAWLIAAPGWWTSIGPTGLGPYERGVVATIAVTGLATIALVARRTLVAAAEPS